MLQLSPQSIRIIKSFDDGKNAKHFTFQAISFTPSPVIIGQFFMLHVPGVGAAPFTYASLPDNQGRFNALIRKVGEVTEAIFSLNIGAVLGYTGSLGVGWPLDQLKNKEVLIVAGGCGLATIAALINYLIEKGQANTTTLIYGASTTEAQVLNVERANWKSALLVHDTLLDSPNT
jgi:anaerobic sulfite reductase subunit B